MEGRNLLFTRIDGVDLYATHEKEEYALITQAVFFTSYRCRWKNICSSDVLETYGWAGITS